ncbi:LuxR C-terminal-related transcriptional regulator [Streptacidiphilus sp. N1-10]|uniref:LuxR C-terminal-related transcriptional regulator n=1 Tax=Streptacidiphilus jeojiensis TaxID=3229225 RepID=A0ABV6XUL1_9ACTN
MAAEWSERNTVAAARLINDAAPLLTTLQRLVEEQRESARERRELLHLEGAESIERAITESLRLVEHEILACLPQGPPGTAASHVATGVRAALARGIPVRTIYPNVARQQKPLRRHIEAVSHRGAEVRTVPWLFAQSLIIDRRVAFLPEPSAAQVSNRSAPDSGEPRHLQVSSPNVVAHFVDHFEMLWAMGQRWDGITAVGDPASIALDDEELAILGFLDQGLTMDAIAHRLGVSERTLSNRLGQLKGKFNVTSLYALGSRWQALQDSQSIPGPRATEGVDADD